MKCILAYEVNMLIGRELIMLIVFDRKKRVSTKGGSKKRTNERSITGLPRHPTVSTIISDTCNFIEVVLSLVR